MPEILLLAAGLSRRFGTPKLAARLEGRALLEIVLEELLPLDVAHLRLVVGADFAANFPSLRHPSVAIVTNERPADGLASSIRVGMLGLRPEVPAVMLCLADQVGIVRAEYRRLIEAWRARPQAPAAALYGSQLGAPAVFPRTWFARLQALEGDRGAGPLLREGAAGVTAVPMPSAAFDVDTPADLDRLVRGPRNPP
jgi:molybdenum cofactor cytidylyltransferase